MACRFSVLTSAYKRIFLTQPKRMYSQASKLVETETLGNVFLVGINRPEKRNCVNTATAKQLVEAFDHFEKTDDLYVAVLHGKGGHFSAGLDLVEVSNFREEKDLVGYPLGLGPMGPSRRMFKKPVIAAISGYAVAGGLELALMCDMRIMEENAIVGVLCRRFGVPLIDGGTVRLPHLIGLSRALDLILSGRKVSAQEALTMGIANKVTATGSALGEAVKLAQVLCEFPQECMNADRRSAYNAMYNSSSIDEAFNYELANGAPVILKESISGAARFAKGEGRHGSFVKSNPKSKM